MLALGGALLVTASFLGATSRGANAANKKKKKKQRCGRKKARVESQGTSFFPSFTSLLREWIRVCQAGATTTLLLIGKVGRRSVNQRVKEPDVSRSSPVASEGTGRISLPLAGNIQQPGANSAGTRKKRCQGQSSQSYHSEAEVTVIVDADQQPEVQYLRGK